MRPTHAVINLAAIRHNIAQIRGATPAACAITAVVKANAYGHGVVPVSRTVLAAGADYLAVAIPEEGVELRQAGFTVPILVLGLVMPAQASLIVDYELTATVCIPEQLQAIAVAAHKANKQGRVMIKVDTGMSRIGIRPEQLLPFTAQVFSYPTLELRGVYTHLASADSADKTFALEQLSSFQCALNSAAQSGVVYPVVSAGNSAGLVDLPGSHFNTVRPGIILYGLPPSLEMHKQLDLRPAMQLVTKVAYVKEVPAGTCVSYSSTYRCTSSTWLGTLPVGYADGYHRTLSNKGSVLIGGKRRPIAGKVCMDQIVVDIGPKLDVAIGDEAVLFGRQGQEEITVTELAELAGTINYELVCAVSSRVPRLYRED